MPVKWAFSIRVGFFCGASCLCVLRHVCLRLCVTQHICLIENSLWSLYRMLSGSQRCKENIFRSVLKVGPMCPTSFRELNTGLSFTSWKLRGGRGIPSRWSHISLKTVKTVVFRSWKQLGNICAFGSFSSWKLLENVGCFTKKVHNVDWHWWNMKIILGFQIWYFVGAVSCIH